MNNMNPMMLMKITSMLEKFKSNHPKVFPFFHEAGGKIREGAIIEITVTDPEGNALTSNIRVNADDMELIAAMKEMGMGR